MSNGNNCYLGIDIGSTTFKAVLMSEDGYKITPQHGRVRKGEGDRHCCLLLHQESFIVIEEEFSGTELGRAVIYFRQIVNYFRQTARQQLLASDSHYCNVWLQIYLFHSLLGYFEHECFGNYFTITFLPFTM